MEAIVITGNLSLSRRPSAANTNPMVLAHGKPILAHQLDFWIRQGVDRFIFTLGKSSVGIREFFGRMYRGAEVDYVIESKPCGSGGSLLAASRLLLDDQALVISGNSFVEINLTAFKEAHRKRKAALTCAVVPGNGGAANASVYVDGNNKIQYGTEKKANARLSGSYLVERTLFGKLPFHSGDYFTVEGSLVPAAMAAGIKVSTFEVSGTVLEPIGEDTVKLAADIFGSLSAKAA